MIQSIMGAVQLLRSKALQITIAVGLTILVLLKARAAVRQDAVEDTTRKLEKADEKNAADIRHRVADAHRRVRGDGADERGFRD